MRKKFLVSDPFFLFKSNYSKNVTYLCQYIMSELFCNLYDLPRQIAQRKPYFYMTHT